MKKTKKTQLTALMFAAALATGCQNPFHDDSSIQAVYGPAPDPSASVTSEGDDMQEVYGPPVEDEPEETAETSADATDAPDTPDDVNAAETLKPTGLPSLVYGPPNSFR